MEEMQIPTKSQRYYDVLDFSLESKEDWKLHASIPQNTLCCNQQGINAQIQSSINQYSIAKAQNSFWAVLQQ